MEKYLIFSLHDQNKQKLNLNARNVFGKREKIKGLNSLVNTKFNLTEERVVGTQGIELEWTVILLDTVFSWVCLIFICAIIVYIQKRMFDFW